MTFKQAYERLGYISDYLSTHQVIDITELVALQKEAQQLYEFLNNQLITNPIVDPQTNV
ncbi:MAG TPA: hypothetical protein PLW93_01670 [Candidatus Absconditabacterales bacterium]|nr:hypothetical protein [Candidatus Absconditabacterales bacterium]HNG96959.1 hypothetical protein [Candidatus Absconditabacterales bacterium]